jgi:Raf kinase inhibitor-like YbhB/YbcL family protein
MQITSTNFQNLEEVPDKFSAYGENINPALTFSEIPDGAESLALIVEDPDAPIGLVTHWIVYNMSPATLQITEGELPISGVEGTNVTARKNYFGPKPPSGTHRYFFKLFALSKSLEFPEDVPVDREALYDAMDGAIIEQAEIIGTFTAPSEKGGA